MFWIGIEAMHDKLEAVRSDYFRIIRGTQRKIFHRNNTVQRDSSISCSSKNEIRTTRRKIWPPSATLNLRDENVCHVHGLLYFCDKVSASRKSGVYENIVAVVLCRLYFSSTKPVKTIETLVGPTRKRDHVWNMFRVPPQSVIVECYSGEDRFARSMPAFGDVTV